MQKVRSSKGGYSWKGSKYTSTVLDIMFVIRLILLDKSDSYNVIKQHRHPSDTSVPRTTLFSYPPDIRKAIYTTNAIESLNMSLRKITENRGSFPSDEDMFKLLYLALNNISKKWTMPIKNWKSALNQFTIIFENRMPEL
jgi:putative transposase